MQYYLITETVTACILTGENKAISLKSNVLKKNYFKSLTY